MGKNDRHIIIGSGINALTCAALLAKAGRRVLLLEREDVAGGCLKTGDLAPGFRYDPLATTFVLWVTGGAHGRLAADLARHGVKFLANDTPTGVLRPDGTSLLLHRDRKANIATFDGGHGGDGHRFDAEMETMARDANLFFGLLGGQPVSFSTAALLGREAWSRSPRGLASTFGMAMESMRAWLENVFENETNRALFAPWCLHAGLGPETAFSGQMGRIIGFALEAAGAPIVEGGAARMAEALLAIIAEHGGEIRTGADVARINVARNKATGVTLASGEVISGDNVIASVTPNQLHERLLGEQPAELRRYRYGNGNFQLHYALNRPPRWKTAGLEKVQLLHLTDGLDAVSKAVNECERGLLPEVPTLCVGQPSAIDATRAPEGQAVMWLQMPETPRHVRGDAAGLLETGDGSWTPDLREAFADRIEAILCSHIDGFAESVVARKAISPADLQAMNMNLVGGDPYGGACTIDQFFLWRPSADRRGHRTHVKGVWQIGASTHPGPGLSGGSGLLVATDIAG